jgi:hypothetical protein
MNKVKIMPRTPKTEADLRAWEERKGFIGVIVCDQIYRKCADCDQPTKGLAEAKCGKHGGKRQVQVRVRNECQVCEKKKADRANGTMCRSCWVAADPEARGCPGCQREPKCLSRDDGMCGKCVRKATVEANREARRPELAQLCEEQGIEEGPADVTDAAFGTRYVVLNREDDHKPSVRVRNGKRWKLACAVRGCVHQVRYTSGTPNTHCDGHGGGHRCPGPPDQANCPLNNSICVYESDHIMRYIKDGIQYCCGCFCAAFPDDELARNAKTCMHAKEQAVREFLERRFADSHPQLKWVMDRRVNGTRRRPDHRPLLHLLGVKSHDLVLETDENSHWFYLCADERDKEASVHFWLNGKTKPLFFIRFNPDAYDDPVTGARVPSCWGVGPFGVPRVKPSKEAEWAARLEKLAQVVEAYLVDYTDEWAAWAEADRPKPELHAIELFYDDVAVKKNAAAQAFDAIKQAKKKKRKATPAAAGPPKGKRKKRAGAALSDTEESDASESA